MRSPVGSSLIIVICPKEPQLPAISRDCKVAAAPIGANAGALHGERRPQGELAHGRAQYREQFQMHSAINATAVVVHASVRIRILGVAMAYATREIGRAHV